MKEKMIRKIKEEVEILIQMVILATVCVGGWTILLIPIIFNIDLPGLIGGFIGLGMLFGVPAFGVWVVGKIELEI